MPQFEDRWLTCVDCGTQFVFSAGEQQFYLDKNFKNEPKRCKPCKTKRQTAGPQKFQKSETPAVCSQCGRETTLPFRPTQGRPVYCRDCFQVRKVAAG